ncbi:MAG: hypothetical protein M1352_02625 [Patescibacteria group bacterium]|nr:hypothetical protein [Patescibacteria group bacterium]
MKLKTVFSILILLIITASVSFSLGYTLNNANLIARYAGQIIQSIKGMNSTQVVIKESPAPVQVSIKPSATSPKPNWSGPDFWNAISDKRREGGLSPIPVVDILCTLAAIRLNDLRTLGRLDDHNGFKPLVDKYHDDLVKADQLNLYEFLTYGAPTAKDAVDGLFNTLGHKALFTDIYKGGCAYAADTFGVVITSK